VLALTGNLSLHVDELYHKTLRICLMLNQSDRSDSNVPQLLRRGSSQPGNGIPDWLALPLGRFHVGRFHEGGNLRSREGELRRRSSADLEESLVP